MQVAEDLGHDHADDDQEEHHAVARHPLKRPQHHQVGLDDASASCNRDSEMTLPKLTTNKKKHSNNQPAVHRGEETIEDVREIKNKNGDDAEPLQVDLEPPVEAEEPEVDDHVRERHYAIV